MNDSLGNSMLMSIVIFVATIVMLLFVSALSFGKAYKAKNFVIENLESYKNFNSAQTEIENDLTRLGYQIDNAYKCPKLDGKNAINPSGFKYCVYLKCVGEYKNGSCDSKGYYYKVITYTQFKFPVIEDIMVLKVQGETKILGKIYDFD